MPFLRATGWFDPKISYGLDWKISEIVQVPPLITQSLKQICGKSRQQTREISGSDSPEPRKMVIFWRKIPIFRDFRPKNAILSGGYGLDWPRNFPTGWIGKMLENPEKSPIRGLLQSFKQKCGKSRQQNGKFPGKSCPDPPKMCIFGQKSRFFGIFRPKITIFLGATGWID